MGVFDGWFKHVSKEEEARNAREYEAWSFPYGAPQRARIAQLLHALLPRESADLAMMAYLCGRDGYRDKNRLLDGDPVRCEQAMRQALSVVLRSRSAAEIPFYEAVILADAKAESAEDYPDVEALRAVAAARA